MERYLCFACLFIIFPSFLLPSFSLFLCSPSLPSLLFFLTCIRQTCTTHMEHAAMKWTYGNPTPKPPLILPIHAIQSVCSSWFRLLFHTSTQLNHAERKRKKEDISDNTLGQQRCSGAECGDGSDRYNFYFFFVSHVKSN